MNVKQLYAKYYDWTFLCGVAHRKALVSFIHPLVIRFRGRNLCSMCGNLATKKCRTHGSKLCEASKCRMEHRLVKAAVYGDLTRPFCEYFPLDTWRTHAVNSLIAIGVGLVFAWIVVAL